MLPGSVGQPRGQQINFQSDTVKVARGYGLAAILIEYTHFKIKKEQPEQ